MPVIAGSAFLIFLLRQFYLGLPKELDEAVTIDGGGYFTIFFRIILPLSLPAMATAAIIEFMFRWNDLMGPLIYLNTQELYPLSLGLANFTAAYAATPWQLLMAASVMAVLPPLILFFFCAEVLYPRRCDFGDEGVSSRIELEEFLKHKNHVVSRIQKKRADDHALNDSVDRLSFGLFLEIDLLFFALHKQCRCCRLCFSYLFSCFIRVGHSCLFSNRFILVFRIY